MARRKKFKTHIGENFYKIHNNELRGNDLMHSKIHVMGMMNLALKIGRSIVRIPADLMALKLALAFPRDSSSNVALISGSIKGRIPAGYASGRNTSASGPVFFVWI